MSETPITARVGDEIALEKAAFVQLPDGSVVSTYQAFKFTNGPGTYVVDGVAYDVTDSTTDLEPDLEADVDPEPDPDPDPEPDPSE